MPLIDFKDLIVIAVVTDIAIERDSRLINARQLEKRHRLPARYLEPVLHLLVRQGILASIRGPGGGYRLAREPDRITVEDVLHATGTLNGLPDLGRSKLLNAVVAPAIAQAEGSFFDQVSRISIKDLTKVATSIPGIIERG